jgi:hypothetical protein
VIDTTIGILWGVAAPETVDLRCDEFNGSEGESGLLDIWEHECSDAIEAHNVAREAWAAAKPLRLLGDRIGGRDRYVPHYDPDSRPLLLGFWIALGTRGAAGVPPINAGLPGASRAVVLSAAGVCDAHPVAYRNARRRWRRFARWSAEERGVVFPTACLWLAQADGP